MHPATDAEVRASNALGGLTWSEAERCASTSILLVPVGATEQHGPHLPLSTDTDVAVALAESLARRRDDVVVGPAIPYGSSGEHAAFAGTLSIGRDATELLLVELCRSATETFSRVLIVSSHGGNEDVVSRAERRLRAEGRDVRAFFATWLETHDAHAGRCETSLMLAIAPERVRLTQAEAGATEPLAELLPELVARGVRAVSANGVLGDPAGASADEGRRLLGDAVDRLESIVDGWES